MSNQTHTTTHVIKYTPYIQGDDSFMKINSHTWHGITIDTWHVKGKRDYQQMVGYFTTDNGKEITLGRRDIAVMEVDSLDFHNARSKFYSDLMRWSFHGFVDNLDGALTAQDLEASRRVVEPTSPANAAHHETAWLEDHLELYGKQVHWKVTSLKWTRREFEQTLDFYVIEGKSGVERHCLINLPKTEHPYIVVGDYFEQHKPLIAETLGLDLSKKL